MFSRKKKKEKKHKPGMTEAELSKLEEVGMRRGFFNVRKKQESIRKTDISKPRPLFSYPSETQNDADEVSLASSQDSPSAQAKHQPDTGSYSVGGGPGHDQNGKGDPDQYPKQSVLQKAALYGDLVSKNKDNSNAAMPVPARRVKPSKHQSTEDQRHPVPPARKKHPGSLSHPHTTGYDHPPAYGQHPSTHESQHHTKPGIAPKPGSFKSPVKGPPAAKEKGYSVPTPWIHSPTSPDSYQSGATNGAYDYQSADIHFSPPSTSHRVKQVVLRKRKGGDFGFSLRRSSIIEHSRGGNMAKKTVYFAEPGSSMQESGEDTALCPGDRLIAIEGHNIEDASRDEIVDMIRNAKDYVTITVQPSAEGMGPDYLRAMKMQEHSDELHHGPYEQAIDNRDRLDSLEEKICLSLRFSFWEKKEKEQKKDTTPAKSSSRSSAVSRGATGSLAEEAPADKDDESIISKNKIRKGSTSKLEDIKATLGKAARNGDTSEKENASMVVVVSPVTANQLHASSMPSNIENAEKEDKGSPAAEIITEEKGVQPHRISRKSADKPPTAKTAEVPQNPVVKKKRKVVVKKKDNPGSQLKNGLDKKEKEKTDADTPKTDKPTPSPDTSALPSNTSLPSKELSLPVIDKALSTSVSIDNPTALNQTSCDVTSEELMQAETTVEPDQVFKSEPEQDLLSKPDITSPEDPVFDENEWKESDRVWFVRDGNFSAAHLLKYVGAGESKGLQDHKVRIKLELSGETVTVDEEKVEKANPEECDRAENLSSLRHLNECSVIHTLQQRHNGSLAHTYAGSHLVSLCPAHQTLAPSEQAMQLFKGCRGNDMPPHIFSAAQAAYAEMTSTGTDQSILVTGRSGSGKTQNVKNILRYLATTAGTTGSQVINGEKLVAVTTILDSFGGATTNQCSSASRSANLYTLNFDRSGQIGSASIQCMLLETSRVVRRPENEENFRIFYQLVEGADTQLSRELFLVEAEQRENQFLFDPDDETTKTELWREEATNGFKKLKAALELLKFSVDEIKATFNVLAACLHLGVAGSQKVSGSRYQFLKPDAAQKASSLLGVSIENLARVIFQPSSGGRPSASSPVSTGSSASLQRSMSSSSMTLGDESQYTGQDNLEAFVTGLYTEVFKNVVSVINRSLSSSVFHTKSSLIVVDAPGMQCPNSNSSDDESGKMTTKCASLEDLAYNYVQERLQLLFHHNAFTRLHDRYQQENVDCDFEPLEGDVNAVADAIDRPPAQSRAGTNLITDAKGLFWLLDEEALIPGASEESFLERLCLFFAQPSKNSTPILQKGRKRHLFVMQHFMGSCPVEYDTTNWLKLCRENPVVKSPAEVLQDSKKKYISLTFGGRTSSGGLLQGSVVGLDNVGRSLTLRRGPSIRKAWTGSASTLNAAAVVKKKSLSMMKKLQVDSLMDALRRTTVHFVFCFAPYRPKPPGQERSVDTKLLMQQLKGFQLLQATRIHKQGYPEHIVYSEFRRCYEVLCRQLGAGGKAPAPGEGKSVVTMDDREATEYILQQCDVERSQYRLGISQVLCRSGILHQLEKRRNDKLNSVIVAIQAQCRGYLARKMHEKRKVQVVAIRCIQRNVRKFLVVRQWPWWRLLTKVLPLVEVHRTEEDLREKEAELELLKAKYDKVVAERDDLKSENEKYETQFNEVVAELSEEQATASHATEMLEQETRERMKLEREVKEMQTYNSNMRQRIETMEVELAEQRLLHATEHDGYSSSDEEADAAEYKMRYERMRREAEFKHKKSIQEYEEKVEQAESDKKHAEKKLHQLQEELDEQERIANQHKRKSQKTLAELNDARVHLEETNAKLHELEKKQRKFDSELYAVQAELTEMKMAKDRLQREKDQLSMEIYTKRNMLEENTGDIDILQKKIERLEQELEETTAKDTEDGQMLNSLKKQKRELEAKLKDQEEELDEQAGQIQMLQQSKERLEMTAERSRQQHSKEIESKEEELEEMRVSYQKKVKHLENQLEEEEEERSASLKQRRELEQQLAQLRDRQPYAKKDAEAEKRLRKDLKRYKALLDDAQTMIDHLKTDAVNKQQLKQLKSQLEESQYTCANAVKSKKAIELELEDVQAQLEEISKAKQDAESRISTLQREKHELNSRIEEDEDDAKELARKYKNVVNQQCEDRKEIVELNSQVDDHKREKEVLNEKILTLQSQLEYMQDNTTDKSNVARLESKVRDLDTKLDFEKTSTRRLEVQLARAKDQAEKLQSERDSHAASEHREKEQSKRLQKQLRDAKDEQSEILKREQEALQKQHELELELMEYTNQNESLQADLKLAFKRISDLQIAFEDLEDSDLEEFSGSDDSDSDSDPGGSKLGAWRRNITSGSRVARSVSNSSRVSTSEEGERSYSKKRAKSPDESKFSDSSTSTVRSFEKGKESDAKRKERAKHTRIKLLKELKSAKTNGGSLDFSDAISTGTTSVLGGESIVDAFAKDYDSTGGRSTVLSKISFRQKPPVQDSMSLCGDIANMKDFDTASLPEMPPMRPNSVMGTGSEYNINNKGGLLSKVGKAGGRNAIKLELDRMSKSLADEDPSVLLYASPADISNKLGLGKTRSFRTLNENIMAVKSKQNLPEKQKKKLAVVDKVNQEISSMKEDTVLDRIASRRSGRATETGIRGRPGSRGGSYDSLDADDALSSYSAFSRSSSGSGPRSATRGEAGIRRSRRLGSTDRFSDGRSSEREYFPAKRTTSRGLDFGTGGQDPGRISFLKDDDWEDPSVSWMGRTSRDSSESQRPSSRQGAHSHGYGGAHASPGGSSSGSSGRPPSRSRSYYPNVDSYYTDGESPAATARHERRRSASVSYDNMEDHQFTSRTRGRQDAGSRMGRYSRGPAVKQEDEDDWELETSSDYMLPPTRSREAKTSPSGPLRRQEIADLPRGRAHGSWSGDDRSSYSFDAEGDDVSLARYGVQNDDTDSVYSSDNAPSQSVRKFLPEQDFGMADVSSRSYHARSNMATTRPRSREPSDQELREELGIGRTSRTGRPQSRADRGRSAIEGAHSRYRSASVDMHAIGMNAADTRSRSTSRSRMGSRSDRNPPPPGPDIQDDGDINIDSIISKYLYKT